MQSKPVPIPTEPAEFPAFWCGLVNDGRFEELARLYAADAVLMPTFAAEPARTAAQKRDYFAMLAGLSELGATLDAATLSCERAGEGAFVVSGVYDFTVTLNGEPRSFPSRFTFVIDLALDAPILHHHSSRIPEPPA